MRLLVIEDEVDLLSALRTGLVRSGHGVDVATTIAEALEKVAFTEYDLLILDVMLPDGTGFDLLRRIREGNATCASGRDVRVLMLTARSGVDDRVEGLDSGADDYLTKPFAFAELQARVRALLRRDPVAGIPGASPVLSVGPLRLDTAKHLVTWDGAEISLTRKEFGVLEYLMRRPGHVISPEELLEHVWDENADPFTQTVRVTVGTLRRKLTIAASLDEESAPIETVIGRGYRLRESL